MPSRLRRPNLLLQTYVVSQLVGVLLAEAIADSELTPSEYAVQSVVGGVGPIMPSELAQLLGTPPTTLSAHIARFMERGHLEKTPNPRDRRSHLLTLTPKGRAAVAVAREGLVRTLDEVTEHLRAGDAETIRQALARYERALREVQASRQRKPLQNRTN